MEIQQQQQQQQKKSIKKCQIKLKWKKTLLRDFNDLRNTKKKKIIIIIES